MRFNCNIVLNDHSNIKIPKTYRKNFLSLIKETLTPQGNPSELYLKYYSQDAKKQNIPKPFTFSVYIPIDRANKAKNYFTLYRDTIRFHLSSYDPVFLMSVYNGLIKISKKGDFPLFSGTQIKIKNFHLEKDTFFRENQADFKPYSPVLIRQISGADKSKKTEFISEGSELLKEALFNNINFLSKKFLDIEINKSDIEIDFPNGVNKVFAISYAGEIGINDIIRIKAAPEILKLIYDAGLGAKRSQGYGMLEAVI